MKSKLRTRLAIARTEAGISQAELSQRTGVSLDHIQGLEAAARTLTGTMAGKLAEELKVSSDWLMGYAGERTLNMPVEEMTRAMRDHLVGLIEYFFDVENYKVGYGKMGPIGVRQAVPAFPQAQFSAIKAEIRRLFNYPTADMPPLKSPAAQQPLEPSPQSKRGNKARSSGLKNARSKPAP